MSYQSLSSLVILDLNTLINPHCTENQSRFDALVSHVMPLRKKKSEYLVPDEPRDNRSALPCIQTKHYFLSTASAPKPGE